MKKFYVKIAKKLKNNLTDLDLIRESQNLPRLHEFVVDLKTSLPETIAYENSKLLLDGLRVTKVEDMNDYIARLYKRLDELKCEYLKKSGRDEC